MRASRWTPEVDAEARAMRTAGSMLEEIGLKLGFHTNTVSAKLGRNPAPDAFWNDENTAEAIKLYTEGMSASQIARRMDGATRNAILGRLHRLGVTNGQRAKVTRETHGLAMRAAKGALKPKGMPSKAGRAEAVKAAAEGLPPPSFCPPKAVPVAIAAAPRHWFTRTDRECAFPVDGEGADVRSCCNPVQRHGLCAQHVRVCYTLAAPPKSKTRPTNEGRGGFRAWAA